MNKALLFVVLAIIAGVISAQSTEPIELTAYSGSTSCSGSSLKIRRDTPLCALNPDTPTNSYSAVCQKGNPNPVVQSHTDSQKCATTGSAVTYSAGGCVKLGLPKADGSTGIDTRYFSVNCTALMQRKPEHKIELYLDNNCSKNMTMGVTYQPNDKCFFADAGYISVTECAKGGTVKANFYTTSSTCSGTAGALTTTDGQCIAIGGGRSGRIMCAGSDSGVSQVVASATLVVFAIVATILLSF